MAKCLPHSMVFSSGSPQGNRFSVYHLSLFRILVQCLVHSLLSVKPEVCLFRMTVAEFSLETEPMVTTTLFPPPCTSNSAPNWDALRATSSSRWDPCRRFCILAVIFCSIISFAIDIVSSSCHTTKKEAQFYIRTLLHLLSCLLTVF